MWFLSLSLSTDTFAICDRLCDRGLIADPNSTHLDTHSLNCEFGTTLKLGPNNYTHNIPLLFGVL